MSKLDLLRPKEDYEKILLKRESDGQDFYKKRGGEFVDVLCPACGKDGYFAFQKYGFTHKECASCNTLFCSPRPTEGLLKEYYATYDAPRLWTRLLLSADRERKVLQHEPRAKKIISIIKDLIARHEGIALDMGAGTGAFASCLKKEDFFKEVIAMDFSSECVSACKKNGLKAREGSIADVDPQSIDFISMMDLIEHLFDPSAFLKMCYSVLRKDGALAIATPNCLGFDFRILKEATRNITPPEHLNYFNTRSLPLLLHSVGFKTLSLETPGILDVEIVLREKGSGFSLTKNNDYIEFLLEQDEDTRNNFQSFLTENRLSSHLFLIAQKQKETP